MARMNTAAKMVLAMVALNAACVDDASMTDDEWTDVEGDEEDESWSVSLTQLAGNDELGATGIEVLDVTLPASSHAQGLPLPLKVVRPKAQNGKKRPAIMVLHGSGGLLKTPANKQGKSPCSPEMEAQYVVWSERLANLGYTVVLPSSYSARGFCDNHDDAGRTPKTFDGKPEQILGRMYDIDATSRYMCSLPDVDCDRMGVMGFSQGGTMTMLALHWQFEHAIQEFRKTSAKEIDGPIPDIKPGRPEFQVGIAYYPGCGFDGLVPLSTNSKGKKENKYMPTAPLSVQHGSKDLLVDHCSTAHGSGARQTQSGQVSDALDIDDQYQITVYKNAEHGFDYKDDTSSNKSAQDAALQATLKKLAQNLK